MSKVTRHKKGKTARKNFRILKKVVCKKTVQ